MKRGKKKKQGLQDQYKSTRTSWEWVSTAAYLLLGTPGLPLQECICFLASLDFHIQNYLGGKNTHSNTKKRWKKNYSETA